MKVFDKTDPFTTKVNFVDENNILVGYDLEQNCCEQADWFIIDSICDKEKFDSLRGTPSADGLPQVFSEKDYVFDPGFFEEVSITDEVCWYELIVVFRLISKTLPDLYLHLFNCHNGYYSHGFEMKMSDKTIQEGSL